MNMETRPLKSDVRTLECSQDELEPVYQCRRFSRAVPLSAAMLLLIFVGVSVILSTSGSASEADSSKWATGPSEYVTEFVETDCGDYCSKDSCDWTNEAGCPWRPEPKRAEDDWTVGFKCCCVHRTSEAEPCGGSPAAGAKAAGKCTNLVVLFDGTWNYLKKPCDIKPSQICETQVANLWRMLPQTAGQLVYFEQGVSSPKVKGDDGNTGVGTEHHFHNGFEWLAQKYAEIQGCKKIFVFGFSRGTISARMMQGAMARIGIPKPGYFKEALLAHASGDGTIAAAFKSNSAMSFGHVSIEFMGFYDPVLRTLLDPIKHWDTKKFFLKLTSVVKTYRAASALNEYREIFDGNELIADKETDSQTVWFMGTHGDVGKGSEQGNIVTGWMLDTAESKSLVLPAQWRELPQLAVSYLSDLQTEVGIDYMGATVMGINLPKILEMSKVRNPWRCRESKKVKIHESVFDRMAKIKGWVPFQQCCPSIASKFQSSIERVSNAHYKAAKEVFEKSNPKQVPQWIKVTIGKLKNAPYTEVVGEPEFQLLITGWQSEMLAPAGEILPTGCCHRQLDLPEQRPDMWCAKGCSWYGGGEWLVEQDFSKTFVLPNEPEFADQIAIEIIELDTFGHDYIGRVTIDLKRVMQGLVVYPVSEKLFAGKYATLEVQVELLIDDAAAEAPLAMESPNVKNEASQCKWLGLQLGSKSEDYFCKSTSPAFASWMNLGNAAEGDCKGFMEDLEWG